MLRMKELRLKKNMSQSDVAKVLGITQQAYANYEREARQADYATLKELSELFGCTIDYLLGRDQEQEKSLDEQLEGIDFALFGEVKELTEDQKRDILNYVKFVKSRDQNS